MSDTLVQDLLEAGIHFGQRRSWNPKMKPYIWARETRFTSSTSARPSAA